MRFFLSVASAILALLALAGCAKPLPPEKSAYVGAWTGPGISLVISQEGRVAYRRANDGGSWRKIDAPLQEFQGDSFVVGVGPLKTTFVVSAPPRQLGTAWRMTVDGIELTRAP
jgi:hypothetical protein